MRQWLVLATCLASVLSQPDLVIDSRLELVQPVISFETIPLDSTLDCISPGDYKLLRFGASVGNIGGTLYVKDGALLTVRADLLDSAVPPNIVARTLVQYCAFDSFPLPLDQFPLRYSMPSKFTSCASSGLTVGWTHFAHPSLDCQYLDISTIPSGDYTLTLTAGLSANGQVDTTYANDSRSFPVTITSLAPSPPPPPSNDVCAEASRLDAWGTGLTGSSVGASHQSPPEPSLHWSDANGAPQSTSPSSPTVWYKFRGGGLPVSVNTCHPATTYDTTLLVYEGPDCPQEGSTPVATSEDAKGCGGASTVKKLQTVKNTMYYVVVMGKPTASGKYESGYHQITVMEGDAPPIPVPMSTISGVLPTFGAATAIVGGHRIYKIAQEWMNAKLLDHTVKFADFLARDTMFSIMAPELKSRK